MDIRFIHSDVEDIRCDALVVGAAYQHVHAKEKRLVMSPAAQSVDGPLNGVLQALYDEGEFKAEVGELATIYTMGKLATRRVIVVGLGELEKLNAQQMQRACGTAARHAQATGAHSIALSFEIDGSNLDRTAQVQAVTEGALLGIYTFKKYQQAHTAGNGQGINSIHIIAPLPQDAQLEPALQRAQAMAQATNFARDMVNEPPNVLTPTELANRASLIARRLTDVETRLAELARTRDQLAALAARAAAQDPADCQGYCSIIAAGAPPAALGLPATGKA